MNTAVILQSDKAGTEVLRAYDGVLLELQKRSWRVETMKLDTISKRLALGLE
jgi:hypothetical protein